MLQCCVLYCGAKRCTALLGIASSGVVMRSLARQGNKDKKSMWRVALRCNVLRRAAMRSDAMFGAVLQGKANYFRRIL